MEPSKITIDNFYLATVGLWTELLQIPPEFTFFFESRKSKYYTNPAQDTIIRTSNHWGSGIGECNWYIRGYKRGNSYAWRGGKKTASIPLSDFIDIRL